MVILLIVRPLHPESNTRAGPAAGPEKPPDITGLANGRIMLEVVILWSVGMAVSFTHTTKNSPDAHGSQHLDYR